MPEHICAPQARPVEQEIALTDDERAVLLNPCDCGHTINDHGSLVACWVCEDDGDECVCDFEALLCERIAAIVADELAERLAAARAEALREAADAWTHGQWSDVMLPKPTPPAVPVIAYSNRIGDWLRDRADRIGGGGDRQEGSQEPQNRPQGRRGGSGGTGEPSGGRVGPGERRTEGSASGGYVPGPQVFGQIEDDECVLGRDLKCQRIDERHRALCHGEDEGNDE